MAGETCTHADIADDLGVSVTTVKSYRRKFPTFMPVAARGKPLRFPVRIMEVCRTIRSMFADGLSVEEVSKKLSAKFPEYSKIDSLSILDSPDPAGPLGPQLEEVLAEVRALAGKDAGSDALVSRVEALELSLAEVRHSQDRLLAGQEEISRRLEVLAGQLAAMPGPEPRRVVTVRGAAGRRDTYELGNQARENTEGAHGGEAGAARPPREFTAMPVVVRSERGEFLGVTDKTGRAFTLAQFEEYLLGRAGLESEHGRWKGKDDDWGLSFGGLGPEAHGLGFRRTRTQRGNLVALFHHLDVGGRDMSDTFRIAFFRQIKEAFDR